MNKVELTASIAEKLGVSKKEAGVIITTVITTITDGAKAEGECIVPGLGKIVKVKTAARAGTSKGVTWSKEEGETLKLRLSKAGKSLI